MYSGIGVELLFRSMARELLEVVWDSFEISRKLIEYKTNARVACWKNIAGLRGVERDGEAGVVWASSRRGIGKGVD